MGKIGRKTFIKKVGVATLAGAALMKAASCAKSPDNASEAPGIQTSKKYQWKMVTTWPPNFPILGEGAQLLADWIKTMSAGRLEIKVFGGGELVPALEAFDAVSSGTADIASGAAYYWAGKSPATQFFASVPFGMNAQQINAWFYGGGGLELWRELYAGFNLIPFPGGNTGVQAGGWFNKEINTIRDFKGLKMRIPGLGGKVIEKAGGTPVLSSGSEIYTNLERGVIDATEWIGPYHDYKMGFHKIAKYCYFPGWHEPGSVLEIIVNKTTFESLPADLQAIVETAAARLNGWVLSEIETQNAIYLQKLKEESKVEFRKFSPEIIAELRKFSTQVIDEITASDPFSKKVFDSFQKFQKQAAAWSELTEKSFYELLQQPQ
ncbi:MAG TPA: TRAP transporter substrate-binding protein [Saprospiraceae bacterium]|nr:TRAP transporter substrate-binding protein [Saprospiraceae bacterium]